VGGNPKPKGVVTMALHWDATDCDPIALADENKNKTQHLCFVLMAIGARKITEQNYRELHRRASLYEKLFGGFFCSSDGSDLYLTEEDFQLRIGYVTNASTLTQRQFVLAIEKRWFWEFAKKPQLTL
jgi:hypothetical protein